ncbi:MAG TPA: hypothetical protein VF290_22230 [Pyrinomonadaceae bacterium]
MQTAFQSDKPLVLFIGRKKQIIRESWRLEMNREVETAWIDGLPITNIASETVRLFIADKLFSTSRITPHRRYGRRVLKVSKPKRGFVQIHLTKNQTEFASA